MKTPKPIACQNMTIRISLDLKNPKVKTWLKKKSKVKKLENITFEEIKEIIKECPEALNLSVQAISTGSQKWHISELQDKAAIAKLFNSWDRKPDADLILEILNKGFDPQTAILDVIKDAQGGSLNLIDGRFTELCNQTQEKIIAGKKDDRFKRHEKGINNILKQIEKEKNRAKMTRTDTLSNSNRYLSSIKMVGYQALHLYEHLRKVIPKQLEIISDRKIYAVIANLLNLRYGDDKYKWSDIKTYIENTVEHREKKST